jgi:ribosomal protein S27E
MNDLNCKKCDKVTTGHDDDVVAVTCSLCSMVDVISELGKLSDEELEALSNVSQIGIA